VRLNYKLGGIASTKSALLVLRRFIAFAPNGVFSRPLHPPDRKARRQVLLLRTFDALTDGADQRTIAAELLGVRAAEARWRISSPSLRARAQRFARGARLMADGRFWDLLF
jgi:hypothetical protein